MNEQLPLGIPNKSVPKVNLFVHVLQLNLDFEGWHFVVYCLVEVQLRAQFENWYALYIVALDAVAD